MTDLSGDYDLRGFAELDAKLRALPNAVAGELLKDAVRAGGTVIRDEARRRAPRKTGTLVKYLRVRILRGRRGSGVTARIGTSARAFYAMWLELGARPHLIANKQKSGKRVLANSEAGVIYGKVAAHPGVKPRPFLRPALDAKGPEAVRVMGQVLWAGIQRVAGGRAG